MEKSQLERASWIAGIISAIVAIITLFLLFFGPSNNHKNYDKQYPSEIKYSDPVEYDEQYPSEIEHSDPVEKETSGLLEAILGVEHSDPVEKEKSVQSIPVEYGYYCCDSRGNRICPIPYKLPLGTPCLCEGKGEGVVCK